MNDPADREVAVFGAALRLPVEERAAFLANACAGDEGLRQRVEAFLEAHGESGAFLEGVVPGERWLTAAVTPKGAVREQSGGSFERVGDRIGRYKLLEQIGEGGCGIVYMAEQEEPFRRKVALKVIKLGMDTRSVMARFDAERQAVALMDHPNIAKVLDAGATGTGRPYFVMELVRGVKITDFCDQNEVSTRERLTLFTQVCSAIQHAHQKGIIHRDIKPSNILVTVNNGVPVPMVIDFGIAKATQGRLTDQTLFTAFEQFLGTPAYMSPEQAVLTNLDIDTRSDIYSLGVLLYELLTGKTPFDGKQLLAAGLDEMRRTIREKEPARPSTRLSTMQAAEALMTAKHRHTDAPRLIYILRGDLDWIVMKALEKDRARRYETANGLAMDIQRHLNDEPVVARPPGRLYLFQKLVRRNKLAFAGGIAIAVSLLLGLGAAAVAMIRIQRDNLQIRLAKDDATEKLRTSYLAEARARRTSGQSGQRFASLEAVSNAAAIRVDLAVRNEAIACLAVSDFRVSNQSTFKGLGRDDLTCFDFTLEKYATGDTNGSITLRAVADNRPLGVLAAPGFTVRWVGSFSPNSRYLRAKYWHEPEGSSDWVWDVARQEAVLKELPGTWAADFSSDSRLFCRSNPDGTISVYDLGSGHELKHLTGTRHFNRVLLDPANRRLACSNETETRVEIRDLESGRTNLFWECPAPPSIGVAWSPDGKRLATASVNYRIYIWDAQTGEQQAVFEGHSQYITSLAFSHAGDLLASTSWDGLTRLWSLTSRRQAATYPGGSWQVQFSPDDYYLQGWQNVEQYGWLEVAHQRECSLIYTQRYGVHGSDADFSADGNILAAGTDDRIRFWDAFQAMEIGALPLAGSDSYIFHPDGKRVIVVEQGGGICVRSLERTVDGISTTYRLGKPRQFCSAERFPGLVQRGALCLDGRHLAVTHSTEGEAIIYDLLNPSTRVVLTGHPLVTHIAMSPDGRWVATSSWHNSLVKVWDARSGGEPVRTLQMPQRTTVAFSPDGRWLATSSTEYQLWEVGTWQPKGQAVHGDDVPQWNLTAFSPDSRVMARTIEGCKIQLEQTLTGKRVATLEAPVLGALSNIRFSPDGSRLAALQADQQVQLWDLRLIRQELARMGLDWEMPPYPPVENKAGTGPVTLEVESDTDGPAATK